MRPMNIAQEIASLPADAQKEVVDFVAFLKTRYPDDRAGRTQDRTDLKDDPFIGMWRDREDMQDSITWVRRLRQGEWEPTR